MKIHRLLPAKLPALGPLEWRVMEALWIQAQPVSVRSLLRSFPQLAYTTVMTTLERLHRKGVLDREKSGRAFLYRPRLDRREMTRSIAQTTVGSVIGQDRTALRPLVSFLIENIDARDADLLDDLERLVRNRRNLTAKGQA